MKGERACERGERRREPSGTATVPAIGEAEDERDSGCPERDLDDLRQDEGACDPIHQRQEVRVEGRKEVQTWSKRDVSTRDLLREFRVHG